MLSKYSKPRLKECQITGYPEKLSTTWATHVLQLGSGRSVDGVGHWAWLCMAEMFRSRQEVVGEKTGLAAEASSTTSGHHLGDGTTQRFGAEAKQVHFKGFWQDMVGKLWGAGLEPGTGSWQAFCNSLGPEVARSEADGGSRMEKESL